MAKMRLDKYLSNAGCGTRTEVKQYIRKGRVSVNGVSAKAPEQKVDADEDEIRLDGASLFYQKEQYYMLHKPAGYVSATSDSREATVMELLPEQCKRDCFPAGRLDKDTEGLLLVTNDGELAHRLLSPKHHVDKVYYARVQGEVTQQDVRLFAVGVDIGDERPTLPADLVILKSAQESEVELTIREGRFHQIKRMFEAVGKQVTYLKRLSMGSLRLDEKLKAGECRPLTKEEIKELKKT